MPRVIVPFAEGVEEIEFTAIVDLLRRAEIEVVTAAIVPGGVTGRSGITIQPDRVIDEVADQQWDMVVLPGGLPNAHLLCDDEHVRSLVLRLHTDKRYIAAICAAPVALAHFGVIEHGSSLSGHPSVEMEVRQLLPEAIWLEEQVVKDGHLITSRGAGTAIEFALRLIVCLADQATADRIAQAIVAGSSAIDESPA